MFISHRTKPSAHLFRDPVHPSAFQFQLSDKEVTYGSDGQARGAFFGEGGEGHFRLKLFAFFEDRLDGKGRQKPDSQAFLINRRR